ncbi:MAG: carboxypeptidase regulatory-like domain-containing protein [Bryobacteraceae bacterium]
MSKVFFIVVGCCCFAMAANAQTAAGLGAISGSVRDTAGATIPNAEVVVSNASNGIHRSLTTNEAGLFSAGSLVPAGNYRVAIRKSGFTPYESVELEVQVGQNLSINAVLTVAGTLVQVNVEASAPLVEQMRMDVSQVIKSSQIQNLPINGRRVDSFVLLVPGVVPDGTFGLLSFRGIAGGNSFLTDGNDTTNQYFNENTGRTRIPTQISQDTVQEFQVLIDGYSAEFGRASGGVVNTVTRSGSNDLHGTAYWFFRNREFNARDRFAATNPPETRHQAGASLGGRIVPNKLFYFFNGEATRRDFPLTASITSPPFFDANGRFVTVQPNGQPTCGAPASAAQCATAIGFFDRQFQRLSRQANAELGFGKLDWRPNEAHSFSASFNYLGFNSPNGLQTAAALNNGAGVGNNANSTVRGRYGRLAWSFLPGGSTVNEFRFGWMKDKQFDNVSDALALPGIGLLGITVQGQQNVGTAVNYPRLNPSENRFQFADNLTWIGGRHTWKLGGDVMSTEDYNDNLLNRTGTYTYPNFTAFALDLSGNTTGAKRWQNYSQGLGDSMVKFTVRDYGLFLQDQYRVNADLTLSLGIRYDYTALPQPIAASDRLVNPEFPATGRIPNVNKNFAPRLGIAYSFNKSRTVLRAGYGLYYARYPGGLINTFFTRNGVSQPSVNFNGTVPADLASGPAFPNRLPASYLPTAPGVVDLVFPSSDFRNAYTQQGSAAIEHELTRNLGITASYLWSRGLHLTTSQDINAGATGPAVTYRINDASGQQTGTYSTPVYLRANRVNPRWNRVNVVDSGGNSYYNALAVQVRKRLSHGIEGSLAYTWSHVIDYNQGPGSNNIFFDRGPTSVFNGDYRGEKGSSAFDQRHRLTISSIWAPVLTTGNRLWSRLLNNWQISQISTLASTPFATGTITVSGTPFAGAAFNGSLNGLGGSNRVPFWPLNNTDIDSIVRLDARVTRIVGITERVKLHLNLEAFNAFNHQYFTNVLTQAYTAANGVLTPLSRFGEGSATGGFPDGTNARRLQVSMRLLW